MLAKEIKGLDRKSYEEYQDAVVRIPVMLRLDDVDRRVVNSFVVSQSWLNKLYEQEALMLGNRSTLYQFVNKDGISGIYRVVALSMIYQLDEDLYIVRDLKQRVHLILMERKSQLTFSLGFDDDLPF